MKIEFSGLVCGDGQSVVQATHILEQCIQEKLKPYAVQLALLQEILGVDETLAAAIIAELGVDMGVFENVSQLSSWAGLCPGNNEIGRQAQEQSHPQGQCVRNELGDLYLDKLNKHHLTRNLLTPA